MKDGRLARPSVPTMSRTPGTVGNTAMATDWDIFLQVAQGEGVVHNAGQLAVMGAARAIWGPVGGERLGGFSVVAASLFRGVDV